MEAWTVSATWARHPKQSGSWDVDANSPREALLNALAEADGTNGARAYTVIGFWHEDQPVAVGVINGDHQVTGGDTSDISGSQGEWTTSVTAASAEQAEQRAISQMLHDEDS